MHEYPSNQDALAALEFLPFFMGRHLIAEICSGQVAVIIIIASALSLVDSHGNGRR